jgi:hypothetical protein
MTDLAAARFALRRPRVPFVLGCADSGTTWLGKIFDSHPDVLYLHEPDVVDRGLDKLPYWFAHEPTAAETDAAGDYLDRLLAARSAHATGTRPVFAKTHRGPTAEALRAGLIAAAEGCEFVLGRHTLNLHVPDLSAGPTRIVVKSVSALGRIEAMLKARPGKLHPILLVRHPCAYVAARLRELKLNVGYADVLPTALAETRTSRRLGATAEALRADNPVERLAWTWTLANAEAAAAVEAAGGSIVFYEALRQRIPGAIKDLFIAAGLWWPHQTETHLRDAREDDSSLLTQWRRELDDDAVAKIHRITGRDALGERAWHEGVALKLAG